MKIFQIAVNFKSSTNSYQSDKNRITDYFDNNNLLTKKVEYDEFDRAIDSKRFNPQGEVIEQMHKDYYENPNEKGFVEHFQSKSQEYVRKAYTKFENGIKHYVEEYRSKTSPEMSYISEFIYDIHNELVNVITRKIF